MKYNIILLIAAFFTVIDADEDRWKAKTREEWFMIDAKCKQETPNVEKKQFLDKEPVRKLLLCVFKGLEIFDEHKGYIPDRVAAQFEVDMKDKKVLDHINDCIDKNEQKSTVEEWAYRGFKCFMEIRRNDTATDTDIITVTEIITNNEVITR